MSIFRETGPPQVLSPESTASGGKPKATLPALWASRTKCSRGTFSPEPGWNPPFVVVVTVGVAPPAPDAVICDTSAPPIDPSKVTEYTFPDLMTPTNPPTFLIAGRAFSASRTTVWAALNASAAVVCPLNVRVNVPDVPPTVTVCTSDSPGPTVVVVVAPLAGVPRAVLLRAKTTPPWMAVSPENVLAPERASVPGPVLSSAPPPAIGPARVL